MSILVSKTPIEDLPPLPEHEWAKSQLVLQTWRNTRNYFVTARKHGIQLDRIYGYIIRAERVETYGHS